MSVCFYKSKYKQIIKFHTATTNASTTDTTSSTITTSTDSSATSSTTASSSTITTTSVSSTTSPATTSATNTTVAYVTTTTTASPVATYALISAVAVVGGVAALLMVCFAIYTCRLATKRVHISLPETVSSSAPAIVQHPRRHHSKEMDETIDWIRAPLATGYVTSVFNNGYEPWTRYAPSPVKYQFQLHDNYGRRL